MIGSSDGKKRGIWDHNYGVSPSWGDVVWNAGLELRQGMGECVLRNTPLALFLSALFHVGISVPCRANANAGEWGGIDVILIGFLSSSSALTSSLETQCFPCVYVRMVSTYWPMPGLGRGSESPCRAFNGWGMNPLEENGRRKETGMDMLCVFNFPFVSSSRMQNLTSFVS